MSQFEVNTWANPKVGLKIGSALGPFVMVLQSMPHSKEAQLGTRVLLWMELTADKHKCFLSLATLYILCRLFM